MYYYEHKVDWTTRDNLTYHCNSTSVDDFVRRKYDKVRNIRQNINYCDKR